MHGYLSSHYYFETKYFHFIVITISWLQTNEYWKYWKVFLEDTTDDPTMCTLSPLQLKKKAH